MIVSVIPILFGVEYIFALVYDWKITPGLKYLPFIVVFFSLVAGHSYPVPVVVKTAEPVVGAVLGVDHVQHALDKVPLLLGQHVGQVGALGGPNF